MFWAAIGGTVKGGHEWEDGTEREGVHGWKERQVGVTDGETGQKGKAYMGGKSGRWEVTDGETGQKGRDGQKKAASVRKQPECNKGCPLK
ncbi:hypothetical protein CK934_10135 [Chitinophaga sp. MD30]|nr:hypothetical protein CK934_10135 [Chitinophaga sp. MD30]